MNSTSASPQFKTLEDEFYEANVYFVARLGRDSVRESHAFICFSALYSKEMIDHHEEVSRAL